MSAKCQDICLFSGFEIDPDNRCFSTANGFLTDAGCSELLARPYGLSGEVYMPAGILNIRTLFAEGGYITDLHLPESVEWINGSIPKKNEAGDPNFPSLRHSFRLTFGTANNNLLIGDIIYECFFDYN